MATYVNYSKRHCLRKVDFNNAPRTHPQPGAAMGAAQSRTSSRVRIYTSSPARQLASSPFAPPLALGDVVNGGGDLLDIFRVDTRHTDTTVLVVGAGGRVGLGGVALAMRQRGNEAMTSVSLSVSDLGHSTAHAGILRRGIGWYRVV